MTQKRRSISKGLQMEGGGHDLQDLIRANDSIRSEVARDSVRIAMNILYVEDDQITARALQLLLAKNGHHVELARTAAQAKAKCSDKNFDLWILDIGLPDGHGGDLLRRLRRMSDTKAIALTGHGLPHEVDEGIDDGFDAYLTKPTSLDHIMKTLDQLYE